MEVLILVGLIEVVAFGLVCLSSKKHNVHDGNILLLDCGLTSLKQINIGHIPTAKPRKT